MSEKSRRPPLKPIETLWKGYRFRSRTEARWAVFMEAAGIVFDYEPEGVHLSSGPYLPDFRLTAFPGSEFPDGYTHQDVWLEIKGTEPTPEERRRCAELCEVSGCPVLLASGPPDFTEQVLLFDPDADDFARDVLSLLVGPLAFMSVGDRRSNAIVVGRGPREPVEKRQDDQGFSVAYNMFNDVFARVLGMKEGKLPLGQAKLGLSDRLKGAYDKARSARFEFGQTESRW